MSNEVSQDIRGVLIAVTGARALLPNATVAEVITYSPPDPIEGAPAWMLGRIRWRGWRLPVISYARMIGAAENEGEFGAKVVVLKALGGNPRHSYFAMLTQGFPVLGHGVGERAGARRSRRDRGSGRGRARRRRADAGEAAR